MMAGPSQWASLFFGERRGFSFFCLWERERERAGERREKKETHTGKDYSDIPNGNSPTRPNRQTYAGY